MIHIPVWLAIALILLLAYIGWKVLKVAVKVAIFMVIVILLLFILNQLNILNILKDVFGNIFP